MLEVDVAVNLSIACQRRGEQFLGLRIKSDCELSLCRKVKNSNQYSDHCMTITFLLKLSLAQAGYISIMLVRVDRM